MKTEAGVKGTGSKALVASHFGVCRLKALSGCFGLLGALLVLAMTPVAASAAECTTTWTGPAEGNWETAGNWSSGKAPTSADVACIGKGNTVNVTGGSQQAGLVQGEGSLSISGGTLTLNGIGEETASIATVSMSGGVLNGAGTLNVTGSLTTSGTSMNMAGVGKTVVGSGATAALNHTSALQLSEQRKFINEGTLTLANGSNGNVQMYDKALLENTGTLKANSEHATVAAFRRGGSSTSQLIVNTGIFEKAAGGGKTIVDVKFENKGAVEAKSGNLGISRGGSSSGTNAWAAAEGKKFIFSGETYSMGSASSWSGDFELTSGGITTANGFNNSESTFTANGGSFVVNGGAVKVKTLSITGATATATLNFAEEPSAVATLNMSGGVLNGPGTLNVTSSFTASGTTMNMSGSGKTVIGSGATAVLSHTESLSLSEQRKFVNEGTLTLANSSNGQLRMYDKALLENAGTVKANSEPTGGVAAFRRMGSSTSQLIVNTGTFEKAAGSGKTVSDVKFENKGAVEAKSGDLRIAGGGSSSGANSWTAAEGKKLILGGTHSMSSGSSFSGDFELEGASLTTAGGFNNPEGNVTMSGGSFVVNGGPLRAKALSITGSATVTLNFTEKPSTLATLNMSGGLLNGPGTLDITSSFTTSGISMTMAGAGKTVVGSGATGSLNQTEWFVLSEQRKFVNEGTLTLANGFNGYIRMFDKALLENGGTFKANSEPTSGAAIRRAGVSTSQLIINTGTFEKAAGSGKTVVDVDFANLGQVAEQSGELKIERPVYIDPKEEFGKRSECGDPVDCATGDFSESQTDLAIGGRGVGLFLTRTYSARSAATAASPGVFGYGWTHSFGDRLVSEDGGKKITLIKGDGSTVPFTGGPGTFTAPSWSQEQLAGNGETGYVLTMPDQTEYAFSGSGKLEGVTDRNGNKTTLSYDEASRLKEITDPAGRKITLVYNGEGTVKSAEDPMGNVVEYAYESKMLKSVSLPGEEGPRWQFKFDGSRRITEMIDGRGGKTTNAYDATHRVTSQTDPAGRVFKFEYSSFRTKVTNEATGAVTDQWFTSNNQPFSITYGYGSAEARTEAFSYDAGGRLLSRIDPAGHKTIFTYNAAGDRTSMKDPAGNETKWTYNGTHDLLTRTIPGGETTTIVRDENGNPESISRPAPGGATQTVTFDYDANGQLESTTDPLERTWSFEHNGQGDLIAESNPEGGTRTWGYNENSYLTSEVSPRGNQEEAEPSEYTTTIDRDPLGRPTEVIDPLGHITQFKYDGNGNLESKTNPESHTTTYFYNAANELTKVEKPNGDTTETDYDGEEQVISQTDGNEKTTTYDRNILGQVVEVIDPLSREKEIKYDLAGNVEKVIDPEGRETEYAYDLADRVIGIDYSNEGTADVTFEYDADGNLLEMVDGTGESRFEYDKLGRLIEAEDGYGDVVKYGYNLANEQEALTYPNGKTIGRTFDDAGRLESVTDWLGGTTAFAYDADSNLTAIAFPEATGRVDEFSYDPAGFMDEVEFKQGGESSASIGYTRNKAAQIETIVTQGLPGSEEQEFTYDENGRLAETSTGTYEFDAADNLVKTPTASNSYNAANELEEGGGVSYTYSLLGERTKATPESGPATSYSYDQAGGLVSIERPEEGEVAALDESFTYDGSRLATSHSVGESVRYLTWDTSRRMPRLLSDEDRSFIFGPGGLVIAHIDSEEVPSYYHHDQLGSTRMLSDGSGEATGAFSYEPYGSIEASPGSESTPLGFAGQYTASGSDLQYLRARQFDPTTAQFMTKDPLAALTREPYAYGGGDPLLYTDPRGLGLCIASLIDCDEDDDPCASPLSWTPLCFLPVGSGASEAVNNTSAGAGDSILEAVPGVSPGPWLRDKFGIDGVENCSAAYKFSKGLTDWASLTRGIAGAGDWVGRHVPDVIKAGRGMARKQNERIVHLPPEAEGMP